MRGESNFDEVGQVEISILSLDQRIPADHPLRLVRQYVDVALRQLSPVLGSMYSQRGRPSVPPEKLLRALLLMPLFSIRSERMLMEQLEYNLLFRWFVGMGASNDVWDATTFSKNRKRLLQGDVAQQFFASVLEQAAKADLLSDEHFTVDGTLIEAWASQKSFQPKPAERIETTDGDEGDGEGGGRNSSVDFKGERRLNETHQSTTDPAARLYKKAPGQEAKLCYIGHVVMENRNGLVTNSMVAAATGRAEREAAAAMIRERAGRSPITVGADKGYDTAELVQELRRINATPHVAQRARSSAIDRRTTSHAGYAIIQRKRKRVEEIFGWAKTVGMMRKTRHRGVALVGWMFTFTVTAYNLVRMRNLTLVPG